MVPSYRPRQIDTKAAQSKSESKATSTAQQPRKPAAKRPRGSADDFGSLEDDDDDKKPAPAVKVWADRTMPWSHMSPLQLGKVQKGIT